MIETGLNNKVVIVTGGVAGIGRATALGFAAQNCRVSVWDVSDDGSDRLVEEIAGAGGEGMFQKVNVADSEAVAAAAAEVAEHWGCIDVLVNNAGIVRDAQLIK